MNLTSESVKHIVPALIKAQKAMKNPVKNKSAQMFGRGSGYKYADLEEVLACINDALSAHDLYVNQAVISQEHEHKLITTVYHTSGEWMRSYYPLVAASMEPQKFGSCITYARRYSLLAMMGLAAEDDDGRCAQLADEEEKQKKKVDIKFDDIEAVRNEINSLCAQYDKFNQWVKDHLEKTHKQSLNDLDKGTLHTILNGLKGKLNEQNNSNGKVRT